MRRALAFAALALVATSCGGADAASGDACKADLREEIGAEDEVPVEVEGPTWSPEGRRIAFTVVSGRRSGIYALTPADCTLERLGPGDPKLLVGAADWSPDDVLAFDASTPDSATYEEGIYMLSAAGGRLRRVTEGQDFFPEWSPDGARIAFVRGGFADIIAGEPTPEYDKRNVWVVQADGSRPRKVTDGEWHGSVGWSPDGRRLVTDTDPGVIEVGVDGSARRVLLEEEHDDPRWSPDGSLLLVAGVDGLAVAPGGRGPAEPLGTPSAFSPDWSPDGEWIAFTDGDRGGNVWIVRPDGSGLRQLTSVG